EAGHGREHDRDRGRGAGRDQRVDREAPDPQEAEHVVLPAVGARRRPEAGVDLPVVLQRQDQHQPDRHERQAEDRAEQAPDQRRPRRADPWPAPGDRRGRGPGGEPHAWYSTEDLTKRIVRMVSSRTTAKSTIPIAAATPIWLKRVAA